MLRFFAFFAELTGVMPSRPGESPLSDSSSFPSATGETEPKVSPEDFAFGEADLRLRVFPGEKLVFTELVVRSATRCPFT